MTRFDYTILQVIPRLDLGGAERAVVEVAGAIVRAGGRALVATSGGKFTTEVVRAGGEVFDLPVHSKNPVTIWQNIGRLSRLMRDEGADLIHAHSRAPGWSSLGAARRMGAPYVSSYHGAYKTPGPIKRFYNSSMLRGDCVIANSKFTADAINRNSGHPPKNMLIIPPGADLEIFDPGKITAARSESLEQSWALPGGKQPLRVLLPARLTSWKGHMVAIEAAAHLVGQGFAGKADGLTLVCCGGAQGRDDYEKALRDRIDELGVRGMVHLVGECEDMLAAYNWADVVISPSVRPEAFGRVAVEAGAMGKPVIAAAHGGALETVIEGETGFLTEPGDSKALAEAINRIAAMSEEERWAMGENGRARAMSVYSAKAMCDATLRAYADLLKTGGH